MESTFDQNDVETRKSLKRSWRHCKELLSASTLSEAWQSILTVIDALPVWALVLSLVLATLFVFDGSILFVALAVGAFLGAVYATVKRAVIDGLKESRAS